MRANYVDDAERIHSRLREFESKNKPLPGIVDPAMREALIDQIVDSEQRVRYFAVLQGRALDPASTDPAMPGFDPLRAAIIHNQAGNYDEAVWLVFLYVHFGKHRRAGWRYVRDVYGKLGQGGLWDWNSTSNDITSFRYWLDDHQDALRAQPGKHGFGNHRKYESLKAWTENGTGEAFESYVDWVHAEGGEHIQRFAPYAPLTAEDRFDALYRSLSNVTRFGRIAKFDFLTTLHRLGLLDVVPPHSYIVGATGPLAGAKMLLLEDGATASAREIQSALQILSVATQISPDVLEDAVCNWQKSPDRYVRFSG
ncbi:alpha-glutamyl/putrescinyl thymine pyrophosphorylase clade 3 protein [Subtercola sp. YIM 133946]|uniref:alpha-glutamyl/putrescinyl thymine pyrophosphorylase clade 3 protein n=1 Tax=Subtercola sp. YIM 133946 TaxID=3118909 RepID=UPI002F94CE22